MSIIIVVTKTGGCIVTFSTAIAVDGPDQDAFRRCMGDVPQDTESVHTYHRGVMKSNLEIERDM